MYLISCIWMVQWLNTWDEVCFLCSTSLTSNYNSRKSQMVKSCGCDQNKKVVPNTNHNQSRSYYYPAYSRHIRWKWTPALATVPHNIRAGECAARARRMAGLGKFRDGTRFVGRHSAIRVASRYGLGIEFWWRRDFLQPSTPTLGPTQPAVQWEPNLLTGGQAAKAWR